jgi:hypothetical protein
MYDKSDVMWMMLGQNKYQITKWMVCVSYAAIVDYMDVHLELTGGENLALNTLYKKVTGSEPEEEAIALNTQIGNNYLKNTLAVS